jgi:hypothetical protein
MNEGLIGFIIMIVVLNVVSRLLRSAGKAGKEPKKEKPGGPLAILEELSKRIETGGADEEQISTPEEPAEHEFIEHPALSEFSELTPWSEDVFEELEEEEIPPPVIHAAEANETEPERGRLPALYGMTEIQRAIVLSTILGPCRAVKNFGGKSRRIQNA